MNERKLFPIGNDWSVRRNDQYGAIEFHHNNELVFVLKLNMLTELGRWMAKNTPKPGDLEADDFIEGMPEEWT